MGREQELLVVQEVKQFGKEVELFVRERGQHLMEKKWLQMSKMERALSLKP